MPLTQLKSLQEPPAILSTVTKKTFVLDTNLLLHNPGALFAFADNEVVIPLSGGVGFCNVTSDDFNREKQKINYHECQSAFPGRK